MQFPFEALLQGKHIKHEAVTYDYWLEDGVIYYGPLREKKTAFSVDIMLSDKWSIVGESEEPLALDNAIGMIYKKSPRTQYDLLSGISETLKRIEGHLAPEFKRGGADFDQSKIARSLSQVTWGEMKDKLTQELNNNSDNFKDLKDGCEHDVESPTHTLKWVLAGIQCQVCKKLMK